MMTLRRGPVVFAVEDDAAQLTWRSLPPGPVTIDGPATSVTVHSDGRPATLDLVGLAPDARHEARIRTTAGSSTVRFRTLAAPPGDELCRFATLNDLHLGRRVFGMRDRLTDAPGEVEHPIRCADAALADLTAWGARHLVIKGDLVDHNSDRAWTLARHLIDGATMPVDVVPGNHDLAHGAPDPYGAAHRNGVHLIDHVEFRDLPGLRLILVNSAIEGVDRGRWSHAVEDARDAAAEAPGPAMLLVHHHPQPAPVPTHFPPGIDSPSARRFLREVRAANPRLLGASGHTHRNRRRHGLGLPWSEVGSPKDYPGVWAGYVVHEGGVRQVVRRVSAPDCLEWLDRTRLAVGGLWGLYSPGHRSGRCFTHVWR